MTLSENEWNLLFTPVIKLVKQISQKLNIIIQQDYINRTIWTINGGNIPIREIFITHRCLNLLRKIGTSNSYPLIYAS
ncbi:hypothetical protein RhiirA5_434938 [Rhizophagus irregularis]|uniref:Uncharacterized protein n=1 Tax=Rhizophagus irregularis TaxID=588596 RepID=A0A2N0NP83_9GLOM|nr:hypothetical protein RhiirA5_434938 [Rhizophagus irregularis]